MRNSSSGHAQPLCADIHSDFKLLQTTSCSLAPLRALLISSHLPPLFGVHQNQIFWFLTHLEMKNQKGK